MNVVLCGVLLGVAGAALFALWQFDPGVTIIVGGITAIKGTRTLLSIVRGDI